MDMESDRMRNLQLKKKAAETERDVVLEERLLRRDNSPKAILGEKSREALFGKDHPYGRPLIGYEDDISKLTYQDALEFYNKYYFPNNTILILAGDITRDEAMPLIEEYYAPLPRGEEVEITRAPKRDKVKRKKVTHYDKNISNVYLQYSYLAPDLMSEENPKYSYALNIISYLLGGNKNSVLHKSLVLVEDLAISVSVGYSDSSRGQTDFEINVTLKDPKNEKRVKEIIDEELVALRNGKIDEKDLDRTKNLFLIETIYSKESYKSLAQIIGVNFTTGISIPEILDWDKYITEVTIQDVVTAANYVFKPEKLVTGYLKPKK